MAKKECDICGGKIGLLGNRKLDDGNCCKDCANKLSPWMTGRRKTGVEDIKAHLAYREENRRLVQQFNPSSIAGENWKVFVDPNMGAFAVSRGSNFRADNPDIIPLSQVVSCEVERQEHRHEVYQQMPDGTKKSYFPQRFDYSYDFKIHIRVDAPWFNEIDFQLNPTTIPDRYDPRYHQCEATADQIRALLLSGPRNQDTGMNFAQPGQFQQPMQPMYQQQPMQQGYPSPAPPMYQQPMQPYQQQPVQPPPPPPAASRFCQNCGSAVQGKFCPNCGAGQ